MLKIITSLSFLYLLTAILLVWYGIAYYTGLSKPGKRRKLFLPVFAIIVAACISFLWFNFHAPLSLQTFSNTDHYFIRHDGFLVYKNIELGRSDTASNNANSFNRFSFSKQDKKIVVASSYSEDPLYASDGDVYKLISVSYPVRDHAVSFQFDSTKMKLAAVGDSSFKLSIGGDELFETTKELKKGSTAWSVFRDNNSFINSSYYTNESLIGILKNIFLLRNDVSREKCGELYYFLSGRLFDYTSTVKYDEKNIKPADFSFKATITDGSRIAWGVGFLDNNKNQFRLKDLGKDSFALYNRFPVSYPLTEEHRDDWTNHRIGKFLVSNSDDLLKMPAVFREGFLFPFFESDSADNFSPVLLSYQKAAANAPLQVNAKFLDNPKYVFDLGNDKLLLPSLSKKFGWMFSLQNTFDWEFGNASMNADQWQFQIFGLILFFFAIVFITALIKPVEKISWVWQVLSCISIVLLTTRFFLYWRYKSFPPYDGIDLPSQQQLQSIWNFRIIIVAGILLAIFFGLDLFKSTFSFLKNKFFSSRNSSSRNFKTLSTKTSLFGIKPKIIFFALWFLSLSVCYGWAALKHFDVNNCRHISLVLMGIYFIFLFISYKHSPLIASAEKSWWKIDTSKRLNVLVSNPIKILLSISLLGVFVFIDIGFAIVFLNFLLFNEAFLCINYAISGLSAGNGKNRKMFSLLAVAYSALFIIDLVFAPYILGYVLQLSQLAFTLVFAVFFVIIILNVIRIFIPQVSKRKIVTGLVIAVPLVALGYYRFVPKETILDKAERTKYRIDVLTMPADKAIQLAYEEGKTYEPVIRAAQNQWFINTFIYEKNNPTVNSFGFHLLPQAPQNKGAKYNAQATDLVASRFFIAEHGKWSVLFFVLLLILPVIMLAPFYKLYPDFTNRVNSNYPTVTLGFTLLNYLLISALLVILAATGKYIFFGQDLPFGSILSKQSVLFPSLLIIAGIYLFGRVPAEYYSNKKKNIPGLLVFSGLAILLLFVKPDFNKNKEFNVSDLSKDMDSYIQLKLQPVLTYFDTAKATRRLPLTKKDELFADSLKQLYANGMIATDNKFFEKEINTYIRSAFSKHIDQNSILYLDLNSGRPELAVNDNYFRVEPPPHLQHSWAGNVYADTSVYNVTLWDQQKGSLINKRLTNFTQQPNVILTNDLSLSFRNVSPDGFFQKLYLINSGQTSQQFIFDKDKRTVAAGDSILLQNPSHFIINNAAAGKQKELIVEPDAFMKNYFVNGNRFYAYPLGNRFIWARNFAESISPDYINNGNGDKNAFVSLDFEIMDSLSMMIQQTLKKDSSYKKGAEYGICIADGNGRLLAMNDFIKDISRPDPNNKAEFNSAITGENGMISQSLLRKQVGNINLLRLNPGPGSTLKPLAFTAVASQLKINWDQFASDGFSHPQNYWGGEKVAQYDFEEYHGLIKKVTDYFRLSDNYYHSNVLLLGSYPKQQLQTILTKYFVTQKPDTGTHWPYFSYNGKQYWLDGFRNWPGYENGKANFGLDSSFISIGMLKNYDIYNRSGDKSFERFTTSYDTTLFGNAWKRSGFILPEYGLFDQQGEGMNMNVPYDVFASCLRGHVKGSSQVLIPPVKMVEAFGRLVTQNKNYSLTLNPNASSLSYSPFYIDSSIGYNNFLSLVREDVFEGMKQALFNGTAGRLGTMLKNGSPYYYYAKTGTTGDNAVKTKSKLFVIVISAKDLSNPDFTFKNYNKFYTIYFTSQNGPAKQNEEFQKRVIQYIESSTAFKKLMAGK